MKIKNILCVELYLIFNVFNPVIHQTEYEFLERCNSALLIKSTITTIRVIRTADFFIYVYMFICVK